MPTSHRHSSRGNLTKNKETKAVTPKKGDEMGAANVAGIINYIQENRATVVTTSGDNQGNSRIRVCDFEDNTRWSS